MGISIDKSFAAKAHLEILGDVTLKKENEGSSAEVRVRLNGEIYRIAVHSKYELSMEEATERLENRISKVIVLATRYMHQGVSEFKIDHTTNEIHISKKAKPSPTTRRVDYNFKQQKEKALSREITSPGDSQKVTERVGRIERAHHLYQMLGEPDFEEDSPHINKRKRRKNFVETSASSSESASETARTSSKTTEEIDKAEARIQELRDTIASLEERLRKGEERLGGIENQAQAEERRRSQAAAEREGLERGNETLRNERRELVGAMEGLRNQQGELRDANEQLKNEQRRLDESLKEARRQGDMELEERTKRLGETDRLIEERQAQLDEIAGRLKALQLQQAEAKKEQEDLGQANQRLGTERGELQEAINGLKDAHGELERARERLSGELRELQEAVNSLKAQQSTLKEANERLSEEQQQLQNTLEAQRRGLKELGEDKKNMEEALAQGEIKLKERERTLAEAQRNLESRQADLEQIEREINIKRQEFSALDESQEEILEGIEIVPDADRNEVRERAAVDSLKAQQSTLQEANERLSEELQQLQNTLETQRRVLRELGEGKKNMEDALAQGEMKLKERERTLAEAQRNLESRQADLEQIERQINLKKQEFAALDGSQEEILEGIEIVPDADRNEVRERLEEADRKLGVDRATIADLKRKIDQLKAREKKLMQARGEAIATKEGTYQTPPSHSVRIMPLKELYDILGKDEIPLSVPASTKDPSELLKAITDALDKNSEEMRKTKAELERTQKQVEQNRERVEENRKLQEKAEIEDLNNLADELLQEMAAPAAQPDPELLRQVDSLKGQLQQMEQTRKSVEEELQGSRAAAAELEKTVEEQRFKMVGMELEAAKQQEAMIQTQAQIGSIKEILEGLQREAQEIEKARQKDREKLERMKNELDTLQAEKRTLEMKLAEPRPAEDTESDLKAQRNKSLAIKQAPALQQELNTLREQVKKMEADRNVADEERMRLKRDLAASQAETKRLRDEMFVPRDDSDALAMLNEVHAEELAKKDERLAELVEQQDASERDKKILESQLDERNQNVEALNRQIHDLRERNIHLEAEMVKLTENSALSKREKEAAIEDKELFHSYLRESEEERVKIKNETRELARKLAAETKNKEALDKDLEAIEADYSKVFNTKQAQEKEIERLKSQLAEANESIALYNKEADETFREGRDTARKIKELREEAQKAAEAHKAEVAALQNQIDETAAKKEEIENEKAAEAHKAEVAALQNQINETAAKKKEIENEYDNLKEIVVRMHAVFKNHPELSKAFEEAYAEDIGKSNLSDEAL